VLSSHDSDFLLSQSDNLISDNFLQSETWHSIIAIALNAIKLMVLTCLLDPDPFFFQHYNSMLQYSGRLKFCSAAKLLRAALPPHILSPVFSPIAQYLELHTTFSKRASDS
jgi:hypothetical protein